MGVLDVLLRSAADDLRDAKVTLREARKQAPTAGNLDLAISTLDALLGRFIASKQQLDTKAALVIPAIGVIGGLAASRAAPMPSGSALVVGVFAVFFAVVAAFYAMAVLWPTRHHLGPNPLIIARATSLEDELAYKQSVVDGLALAILDLQRLVTTKGDRLNVSLAAGTAAVILLLIFAAVGGL